MYVNGIWRRLETTSVRIFLNNGQSAEIHKINYNSVQREVVAECISLGIYQEYDMDDALLFANELLKRDVISDFCGGVYIYLKERVNGIPQKLTLYDFNGGIQMISWKVVPGALLPLGRCILCKCK